MREEIRFWLCDSYAVPSVRLRIVALLHGYGHAVHEIVGRISYDRILSRDPAGDFHRPAKVLAEHDFVQLDLLLFVDHCYLRSGSLKENRAGGNDERADRGMQREMNLRVGSGHEFAPRIWNVYFDLQRSRLEIDCVIVARDTSSEHLAGKSCEPDVYLHSVSDLFAVCFRHRDKNTHHANSGNAKELTAHASVACID